MDRDSRVDPHRVRRLVCVATMLLGVFGAQPESFADTILTLTAAHGFPNERTVGDPPPNAIDGSLSTWTWVTASFTTGTAYLAVGFSPTTVNHIRLWKDDDGGGGPNIKNLTILYTTVAGAPQNSANYTAVTGLTNGYLGGELLHATSVNSNGTVIGDVHDSVAGDGWASLSFDPVFAAGIAIQFSNPGGTGYLHYRVAEMQVYSPVPEIDPAGLASVLTLLAGGLGLVERRRTGRVGT